MERYRVDILSDTQSSPIVLVQPHAQVSTMQLPTWCFYFQGTGGQPEHTGSELFNQRHRPDVHWIYSSCHPHYVHRREGFLLLGQPQHFVCISPAEGNLHVPEDEMAALLVELVLALGGEAGKVDPMSIHLL